MLFSKIVPNCKKLGLLDANGGWLREKFTELRVIEFEDFDKMLTQANDTFYGLAAGVWTRDIKKAHRAARALQAGTVWINAYNLYDAASPTAATRAPGSAGSRAWRASSSTPRRRAYGWI